MPHSTKAKDPVCGMMVDTAAPRGGQFHYKGADYFFCNPRCNERFRATPETFLDPGLPSRRYDARAANPTRRHQARARCNAFQSCSAGHSSTLRHQRRSRHYSRRHCTFRTRES